MAAPEMQFIAREVESLFRAHYSKLVWYAQTLLTRNAQISDPGRAEEAVQEAFAIAWSKWEDLFASPNPAGWLYNTVNNVVRNMIRADQQWASRLLQAQAALSADSDPADNLEDSADIMTARSASIDQCEEISRQLGLALEVEDLIEQAYVLEVSTPGFSRLFFSLDQMRSYVGDMVELRMVSAYAPENAPAARRAWRGVLREVTDSAVRVAPASVSAEGDICPEAMDEVLVPWDMVRRASRIHIFRQPQKPGKQPARKAAKAAPQGDAPKKGKGKSGKSKHPGRNEAEDI